MIVTTGNEVEMGKITQYLGVVRGIVVRATGIGRGIIGGFKSPRRRQHRRMVARLRSRTAGSI